MFICKKKKEKRKETDKQQINEMYNMNRFDAALIFALNSLITAGRVSLCSKSVNSGSLLCGGPDRQLKNKLEDYSHII